MGFVIHIIYRVSELVAQHEAQRQEDKMQIEKKQKKINELEKKLEEEEQKLELKRKVCQ